jgi:hypothetical protein
MERMRAARAAPGESPGCRRRRRAAEDARAPADPQARPLAGGAVGGGRLDQRRRQLRRNCIGGASHLYRQTLSGLEARLDQRRFVRIHRSTIVNLDRIAECAPASGCYDVTLRDDHLALSRRHRKRVLELVGKS